MSLRKRRQMYLRSQAIPSGDLARWLNEQGFLSYRHVPPHATWYKPDGTPLSQGPTDLYHLQLYRQKGFTLKAPVLQEPIKPEVKVSLPWIASRAKRVLGNAQSWVGTATEFLQHAGLVGHSPDKLGRAIFKANVAVALENEGITVSRGYKGNSKVLKLQRR